MLMVLLRLSHFYTLTEKKRPTSLVGLVSQKRHSRRKITGNDSALRKRASSQGVKVWWLLNSSVVGFWLSCRLVTRSVKDP